MLFTLNNRHDVHYLFDSSYSPQEYNNFPIEVNFMMKTEIITLRHWLDTDAKALLVPYGRCISILHVCCFVSLS